MNKAIKLTIIFISIIIIFGLGFYTGKNLHVQDPNDTFAFGWKAAEKRLDEVYSNINNNKAYEQISGSIIKLKNNEIEMKIRPLYALSDPKLDIRNIIVNSDTIIKKKTAKNEEQYLNEVEQFNKEHPNYLKSVINPGGGPSRYYLKEIKIDELKINDQINVRAGYNIANEKNIIAKEIQILQ